MLHGIVGYMWDKLSSAHSILHSPFIVRVANFCAVHTYIIKPQCTCGQPNCTKIGFSILLYGRLKCKFSHQRGSLYAVKNTKSQVRTLLIFGMDIKRMILQFSKINSNFRTCVVGRYLVCYIYPDNFEDVHMCSQIIELASMDGIT